VYNIINILKPTNKKVAVAFPDAPVKPAAMATPAVSAPFKQVLKKLFRRLRYTTK
jgi:hypothetical protein